MQINTRTFFILIGIVVVILLGFFGWVVLKNKGGSTTPDSTSSGGRNFFPFGKPAETQKEQPPTGNNQPTPKTDETPAQAAGATPRLRKVWNGAIAGYTLTQKEVPVDPQALSTDEVRNIVPAYTFVKTLSVGSKDPEVKELEKALNACPDTRVAVSGIGSPGKEGTTFTDKTKAALIKFQEKFPEDMLVPLNRTKGSGTLDTLSRKKLNSEWPCTFKGIPAKTEMHPVIRLAEKSNGNIEDIYPDTLESKRLTNTTIPRINEALFVNSGTQVLLRYLRDDNQTIDSFLGTIPKETWGASAAPGTLTGTFLESNMVDVSISPDTKRIFSLSKFAGGILGVTGNPDGSDRKNVFSSAFTGWLSSWPKATDVLLTTKASGYATGYAFRISPDTKTSTPEKILGPIVGLTTLPSPDMKSILFSRNTQNGPKVAFFNVDSGKMRDIDLGTFPEKCVWTKDSDGVICAVPSFMPNNTVMPDSWYQGEILFSDSIVRVNKEGLLPNQTLIDPSTAVGERIDAIHLTLSDDGTALYFINKRDDILWQLKL
jgi:hypothetical protein